MQFLPRSHADEVDFAHEEVARMCLEGVAGEILEPQLFKHRLVHAARLQHRQRGVRG